MKLKVKALKKKLRISQTKSLKRNQKSYQTLRALTSTIQMKMIIHSSITLHSTSSLNISRKKGSSLFISGRTWPDKVEGNLSQMTVRQTRYLMTSLMKLLIYWCYKTLVDCKRHFLKTHSLTKETSSDS
jgi:hypothetical protein